MAEFAALPLFTDSWIADTAHLTRLERGLYMDLIILCWRTPECRVPNEIDWLARKLRCSPDEIPTLNKVIAEFMISTGNYLFQKRLRKEFLYTRTKSQKQSSRARSRWTKKSSTGVVENNPDFPTDSAKLLKTNGYVESRGNADNHASGNAPTPTPTPTVLDGTPNGVPTGAASAVELYNATAREVGWPLCQNLTDRRRSALNVRLRECGGLDGWKVALEKARASPLLTGDNDRGWKADFDFLVQAKSFTRLMEGSYDRRQTKNGNGIRDSIAEAERRRDERGHSEERSQADTLLLSRL
jgi:uncharacterized protein YdaU (DUF1376 family)